jgi:hypothetical protein
MSHLKTHKLTTVFLFFLAISFPRAMFAGTLNFSPAEEILYFGEVFAYEKEYLEQGKLMFTMTATSGSCTYSITYGDPYPPVDVRMGTVAATIEEGDSMPIWIWMSCEVPGDHDLHLIIDSTCGTFYRTIKFTCIGYAVVEGNVLDRFTREPVLDASVDALSYYLTVSMRDGGSYYGYGRPGTQVVRVSADGYREQIVSVDITDEAPLTKDFEMTPIVSLGDAIGALQVSSGLELSTTPLYHEDMNDDGRIGLAEAILLLQLISGLR